MRHLALAVIASACSQRPPELTSCSDSLAGVWRAPSGDWMLLDRGATLEGYPLFDDAPDPTTAPRALDLRREGPEVGGELSRRYTRGADACVAKVALHVMACTGQTLQLVLADPSPPLSYAPCEWSARTNPSRRETWTRQR